MTTRYPSTPGVTFKDIDGFPAYCVGDDGSVWTRWGKNGSLTPTIINSWRKLKGSRVGRQGRRRHLLSSGRETRNFYAYRLVLLAFVGPCPEGYECCHNDGDPHNNQLDNLRWDTKRANRADQVRHGVVARGERHGSAKLTDLQIREIRCLLSAGMIQREIGKRFGVAGGTIGDIKRGRNWKFIA